MSPAPVDAESYLRRMAERELLGADRNQHDPGWERAVAARVLVAAGAVEPERAAAVEDDYAVAGELRGDHRSHFRIGASRPPGSPPTPPPLAVWSGPWRVVLTSGPAEIRRITFTAAGVRLSAAGSVPEAQRHRPWGMRHHPGPPFPHLLTLVDDRGTTVTATSGGGGYGGDRWETTYQATASLAADTAWVQVDGHRLDLGPGPHPATVTFETVEPAGADAVWAALERELIAGAGGRAGRNLEQWIEAAVTALTVTGVAGVDDPRLTDGRRVAAFLAQGGPGEGLPEPWAGLGRRQGAEDGPVGQIAIGAVVARLEGCWLLLGVLDSGDGWWSVDVDAGPPAVLADGLHGDPARSPLVWWAEDDLGHRWLGSPELRRSDGDAAEGRVIFDAPLHPDAREVRLLVTGRAQRAVVTVPLAALDRPGDDAA